MILATNVTKKFGKLIALDSINVSCNKGESIALIGPNGSGKTTFIMLAGNGCARQRLYYFQ